MSVRLSDEGTAPSRTKDVAESATRAKLAAAPTRGAWLGVLGDVRLLLIALWLGGAVFFSFVVAPTAFAVLPTHELAGRVVTHTIAVVNVGGCIVGLALLASAFFDRRDVARSRARLVEVLSLAIVAAACGIGHWVVAARMVALRAAMGRPIDAVAADDPTRAAFNSLHGYSVGLMGVAMLAGVVALLLIGRRRRMTQSLER
ncbi:MAG: DUF4149 domain-containing protein [Pyrinomonadaceae bacterium]